MWDHGLTSTLVASPAPASDRHSEGGKELKREKEIKKYGAHGGGIIIYEGPTMILPVLSVHLIP